MTDQKKMLEEMHILRYGWGQGDHGGSDAEIKKWFIENYEAIRAALRTESQPDHGTVKIPTEVDEAKLMVLLGMNYLEANAPEQLKKPEHELVRAVETIGAKITGMHMKSNNETTEGMMIAMGMVEEALAAYKGAEKP